METIEKRLKPFIKLSNLLFKDIGTILGRSRKYFPQPKRRSFVRALFSWIESESYVLKQVALVFHDEGIVKFTTAELSLLTEEQYALNDKGKACTQTKFLKIADNYQFAVRCFCKATGIVYELKKDDSDWEAFQQLVKIRNRITHPKDVSELSITNLEMKDILKAWNWFIKNSKEIDKHIKKKCTELKTGYQAH